MYANTVMINLLFIWTLLFAIFAILAIELNLLYQADDVITAVQRAPATSSKMAATSSKAWPYFDLSLLLCKINDYFFCTL